VTNKKSENWPQRKKGGGGEKFLPVEIKLAPCRAPCWGGTNTHTQDKQDKEQGGGVKEGGGVGHARRVRSGGGGTAAKKRRGCGEIKKGGCRD